MSQRNMLQLGKYLSYTVLQLSEFEAESCIRVVFTLFVFNELNKDILWDRVEDEVEG